ncbi:OLC1v1031513C1 [Oldenlandia corymbosa var. corymbosa]|uniref:OLC1v1031513C1 n=1 Tax=Oldenlandia corymbosa var. corymbosa TaxID=529605 RepID=A0AAV1CLT4_OLDCO|nr:OLC1v1031513C1 [Oldenlandia corymbosa var. corymbosa]
MLFGEVPYNGFKAPCGVGELLELQVLRIVDVEESDRTGIMKEVGKLIKLRDLSIKSLRQDGKELCSSLEKLTNLQELVVASSRDEMLDVNHPISASSLQSSRWLQFVGRLEEIPPWIRNLQGLERITLSLSNFFKDPVLETLQHLPNLFEIRLLDEAYKGESLCFQAGYFLKLKTLCLVRMERLRRMRVEKGAITGINRLGMDGLLMVEELALGIENLSKLQVLELASTSSKLINKLENIAAESEEENDESSKI